jgi:hypothetical protein
MQPVSKQRIGEHSSRTIELFLKRVFAIRFVQNGYKELGPPVQLTSARENEKNYAVIELIIERIQLWDIR